jgi:hypothetical protein
MSLMDESITKLGEVVQLMGWAEDCPFAFPSPNGPEGWDKPDFA